MKPFDSVRLVISREIRERVRHRSFLISSGLTLAVILAIVVLPALFEDEAATYDVGLVGAGSSALARALDTTDLGNDVGVETRDVDERAEAERLVIAGDLDAAVIDGETVVVKEELGDELAVVLDVANRGVRTEQALADAGVSGAEATAITDPAPLSVDAIDPPEREREDRVGLVTFGVFFVFGQLVGLGLWVAGGVVEEKSSRVVEVVLAKIRPAHLLAGKIIGIGVIGLSQMIVFIAAGLVAAEASGTFDLPPGTVASAVLVLAWFVLGYAFYSCAFAMAGAIATRQEELQNSASPLTFLIMGSFVAAGIASGDPAGTVARLASFFPPTASMVMPIRVSAGEAAPWEVVASVAVVLVAIVVVVRIAGRIYAGGALRTRGQLKLKQVWASAE